MLKEESGAPDFFQKIVLIFSLIKTSLCENNGLTPLRLLVNDLISNSIL